MTGGKGFAARCRRELERQLDALGSVQYEFGVFDGRMTRRVWKAPEALRAAGWLMHRNAKGSHVYMRPAGTSAVLVDDLTRTALERMSADGIVAAAVVETSRDNYQAWIRFPEQVGRDIASCVGRVLAGRYDGDPASIDFRHLGRAAGFTNRKAEHRDSEGRYPWVRVVEARGGTTPNAEELRSAGEALFAEIETQRAERATAVNGAKGRRPRGRSAEEVFEREVARMHRRYGGSTDASRADAVAARRLALDGYGEAEVVQAIASSADVQKRKRGHVGDYAERTAAWAFGHARRRGR